jgi:2-aminobenzoate-CoA ligase
MRDRYPEGSSIPQAFVVPPELQPDFAELDGCPVPEYLDLGRAITDAADAAGRRGSVAVVHAGSGRSYTFGDLDELSTTLARGLRALGIAVGDRIAFRASNVPEIAIVAMAAWKAGAVVVPTPAMARAQELRFFLEDVGARALFVQAEPALLEPVASTPAELEFVITFGAASETLAAFPGTMQWDSVLALGEASGEPLDSVHADNVAIIWHSGGTTGPPKAIYHTHRRAFLGSHALARSTGAQAGMVWSAAAPVGHALGFASHTFWPLLHAATVVYIEQFGSPEHLVAAIDRHRIEGLSAITMTWSRMLDVVQKNPSADLSSLRRTYAMWQSVSSAETYDGWRERGVELLNNFGCTAFASWILAPRIPGPVPRASLGVAVPGYEVVAVNLESDNLVPVPSGVQGRLAARGVSGLTYWNRPQMQRRDVRDGWVLLDDVVLFDESGNAAYRGRTDNVISTAGYKVSPVEVEEVLASHPAVHEVAVIGVPDAMRVEVVAAFIVLEDGWTEHADLVRELQDLVRSRLAPYKYPRQIEFVSALPRDHVGKIQPKVLSQWAASQGTPR